MAISKIDGTNYSIPPNISSSGSNNNGGALVTKINSTNIASIGSANTIKKSCTVIQGVNTEIAISNGIFANNSRGIVLKASAKIAGTSSRILSTNSYPEPTIKISENITSTLTLYPKSYRINKDYRSSRQNTVSLTNTAIRDNKYNFYTGKFNTNYPESQTDFWLVLNWKKTGREYGDVYQNSIQKTIAKSPPVSINITIGSLSYSDGTISRTGGILLPDGRIIFVPRNDARVQLYDPATDSYVFAIGTMPGSNAFYGGVLLRDGRAVLLPSSSTTARIYDSSTNTFKIPSPNFGGNVNAHFGIVLQDGRVFLIPQSSVFPRIYDPFNDKLTILDHINLLSGGFFGAVLMFDGRVFIVPSNSTTARIYDPYNNTITIPNGNYPGNSAFNCGVLMSDGRIYMCPANSTTARIYDPKTDSVTTPNGTFPGASATVGGCLLADGRIVLGTYNNVSNLWVYNPFNDTLSSFSPPSGINLTNNINYYFAHQGIVPTLDGRALMIPKRYFQPYIIGDAVSKFNDNIPLSPHYNKL